MSSGTRGGEAASAGELALTDIGGGGPTPSIGGGGREQHRFTQDGGVPVVEVWRAYVQARMPRPVRELAAAMEHAGRRGRSRGSSPPLGSPRVRVVRGHRAAAEEVRGRRSSVRRRWRRGPWSTVCRLRGRWGNERSKNVDVD
jgi:hypothetical protein